MALTMTRPYRPSKTGMYYLRIVVPAPLREAVGKWELKKSLRTKDPKAAKEAAPALLAEFNGIIAAAAERGTGPLTLRQISVVMGAWYREETAKWAEDPGQAKDWEFAAGYYGDMFQREAGVEHHEFRAEAGFLRDTAALLRSHGIVTDRDGIWRTAERWAGVQVEFARAMVKRAEGDWTEDANLARFPQGPISASNAAPMASAQSKGTGATLTELVAGWWVEGEARNLSLSTYQSYSATVANFARFIKHEDASSVTPENVIAFKDYRLATINPRTKKPTSLRTVKDSDLAGLKAVFGWALANRKMTTNPAADVTLKVPKTIRTRDERGFTDTEAHAILKASRSLTRGREGAKMAAAKRWVPWLCAYTGARVGEMAQLRREDVFEQGGHWVVRITPDAGRVKTKQARTVPLHPHLVAQRFPEFAKAGPEGHLFLTPSKAGSVTGPWQAVKNRLREFARGIVSDPEVQPNHGWRHRFASQGRGLPMRKDVVDAILGHGEADVAAGYGDIGVGVKFREISKLPTYPEGG